MKVKDTSKYHPSPVTILENKLDKTLRNILDNLAKNVHDQWAAGRFSENWVMGSVRDDSRKEHPSLIPYDALSESEKAYDKKTVLATIGFLLENGFEIILKNKNNTNTQE